MQTATAPATCGEAMLVPEMARDGASLLPCGCDAHTRGRDRAGNVGRVVRRGEVAEICRRFVNIRAARCCGTTAWLAVEVGDSRYGENLRRRPPARIQINSRCCCPRQRRKSRPAATEPQIALCSASLFEFPQLPSSVPLPPRLILATTILRPPSPSKAPSLHFRVGDGHPIDAARNRRPRAGPGIIQHPY